MLVYVVHEFEIMLLLALNAILILTVVYTSSFLFFSCCFFCFVYIKMMIHDNCNMIVEMLRFFV